MKSGINGILVGCDDEETGGYEWVINNKDWDNGSMEITSRLLENKNKKDFKIYFYVFKTPTEIPANTSDEYRGTVFGRAEIEKVEPFRNNPKKYKYPHHVKLKNLELFQPKIKLEDIEGKLENYGWTEEQKANFGVNLSHHGLFLTEKDCDLINTLLTNNNFADSGEGLDLKDLDDNAGLIIGHYHRPDRMGYEYVLDSCEDDGRGDKILTKVQKFKGKKAYFYVFESYEDDYWTPNEWRQFKDANGKVLGKIFGEGLIRDVKNGKIIYQYVIHYREYIGIDNVKNLVERIGEINSNKSVKSRKSVKQRITIGLPLTSEECNEISELAGVSETFRCDK